MQIIIITVIIIVHVAHYKRRKYVLSAEWLKTFRFTQLFQQVFSMSAQPYVSRR